MSWRAILTLLSRLAGLLNGWLRKRERQQRQAARDRVEAHPDRWFSRHFGGLRTDKRSTADCDETDV